MAICFDCQECIGKYFSEPRQCSKFRDENCAFSNGYLLWEEKQGLMYKMPPNELPLSELEEGEVKEFEADRRHRGWDDNELTDEFQKSKLWSKLNKEGF